MTTQNTKDCFSYLRFSSPGQKGNSSVDRQSPIAETVAKEKGWNYRKEWNAKDLGVSAFKGDNVKTIEAIIQSVKDGKIPQGSVLILESLDRATRLELDAAQQLIRSILKSGLEIFTDMNKRHLTAKSLSSVTDVMLTAVELDAAYQYAYRQQQRAIKGIDKQVKTIEKGDKIYIGGQMPSYIRGVENGKFVIDEARLKVVRHIFAEYLLGTSMFQIAIQLNKGVASGKFIAGLKRKSVNKWDRQTIKHILTNAAYTGDYSLRGVTYKNYLPVQVLSHKDFEIIQGKMKLNAKRRGGSASGNVNSIFNGTGKCSVCGSPMAAIISETKTKKRTIRYNYYGCSSARYSKCSAKGWLNTNKCELDFCMLFLQKNPLELISTTDQSSFDNTTLLKAELQDIEGKISNAIELLETGEGIAIIRAKIDKFKTEKKRVESELEKVSQTVQTSAKIPLAIADIKKLLGVMLNSKSGSKQSKAADDFDKAAEQCEKILKDNEARKKIKLVIPSLVKQVNFDVVKGGYTVVKHNGEVSKFYQVII